MAKSIQLTKEDIREVVRLARTQPPYRDDPNFESARSARIGIPVLARTPEGTPAFWLAPLTVQGWACGFGVVDLQGRVIRMGIFGGNAKDRTAWIRASFFKAPPADVLAEIGSHYPGVELSKPVFSYDVSPAKWGWQVAVISPGDPPVNMFISPGGWTAVSQAGPAKGEGGFE